jgi:hypothetical protein
MAKISMWWLFLTCFGLTIAGIQTLGWWTTSLSAHTQVAPGKGFEEFPTAAVRHRNAEAKHWRAAFMQQ